MNRPDDTAVLHELRAMLSEHFGMTAPVSVLADFLRRHPGLAAEAAVWGWDDAGSRVRAVQHLTAMVGAPVFSPSARISHPVDDGYQAQFLLCAIHFAETGRPVDPAAGTQPAFKAVS